MEGPPWICDLLLRNKCFASFIVSKRILMVKMCLTLKDGNNLKWKNNKWLNIIKCYKNIQPNILKMLHNMSNGLSL